MRTREIAKRTLVIVCSIISFSFAATAFAQWVTCSNSSSATCTTANVGVGTTSPGVKLDVGGALRLPTGDNLIIGGTYAISSDGSNNYYRAGGGAIYFQNTYGPTNMTLSSSGNLGIGTTSPGVKLDVNGTLRLPTGDNLIIGGTYAISSDGSSNYYRAGGGPIYFQNTYPGPINMMLSSSGNLGIGTTSPSSSLHVAGDVRIGTTTGTNTDVRIFSDAAGSLNNVTYGQINSLTPVTVPASGTTRTALHLKNATQAGQGTNQIDLVVDGSISASTVIGATYQDVAEWVPSRNALTAGTVVVIDPDVRNGVLASSAQYQTTVAGVVSASPGVILGVSGPSKQKIATTGRVKVRVKAAHGAIHAGDLLVTSDEPGMAMRSEPVDVGGVKMHRPGTLIGKALEPLESGEGEILVLLSLQ